MLEEIIKEVAEVWMDEYAQYLYMRRPHYKSIDPGDLTKQKALRERLKMQTVQMVYGICCILIYH
nr:CAZy families GT27/CBM13 protein [uncultured bacterium]